MPAPRGIELKPNTAPMQRFVQTQNFGLITKGNQEYEVNKNTLNLTLLRATGVISNPHNPTRGTPAGPPLETPKLQCLGGNKANFAICFTSNEDKMFKFSDEFYMPFVGLFTNIKNKKLLNTKKLIYAIKNENNNLKLRTFCNKTKKLSIE